MNESKWMKSVSNVAQSYYDLSAVKQFGLLLGFSFCVVMMAAATFWLQGAELQTIYSGAQPKVRDKIIYALNKEGIHYVEDNGTGAISVSNDQASVAREKILDITSSQHNVSGFELLSKEQSIGSSRFMEAARYWYAMESEIARTISDFDNIKNARVHLAIPKSSAFIRDKQTPTASILVEIKEGSYLQKGQVEAIKKLVASSVQGLNSKEVTVVDNKGHLLSDSNKQLMLKAIPQPEYVNEQETLARSAEKNDDVLGSWFLNQPLFFELFRPALIGMAIFLFLLMLRFILSMQFNKTTNVNKRRYVEPSIFDYRDENKKKKIARQINLSSVNMNRVEQKSQWIQLKKMAVEDPKTIALRIKKWIGDE